MEQQVDTEGRPGCGGWRGSDRGTRCAHISHAHALGNRTRGGVADGGVRVPEVLIATEFGGLVAGVIIPGLC